MKPHRWLFVALLLMLAASARAADGPVKIVVKDDHVDFLAGDELVSRLHKGPEVAKPYMWPMNGPGGVPLTRSWPMEKKDGDSTDHVHQKSAWFCHGDIIPEGVELKQKIKGVEGVDFWAEAKGHGKMVCTKVGTPKAEGNHGVVATTNEWTTADGVKILDENRIIHLYLLGDARLFVFDIDLTAAVPVTFGDTKEGAFGIRINDEIREEIEEVVDKKRRKKAGPGKLENAEGKIGEKNIWGYVSAWCDYSGPIGGKTVGLTIFTDPSNPQPSAWHSRGYGLMAANPFGRGHSGFPAMTGRSDLVKLGKGDHLKLRYGILLHSGDVKEGKVAERFQEFVKLK